MLKENKGITLIALIVTIIVLIIIAAIGVKAGRESIKASKDNRLLVELDMVQHAVFERYAKYKLTNDKHMLAGTRISYSEAKATADEMGIVLPQEAEYYRLTAKDLKNLGLEDSDYEYVVNYPNGIVMNIKVTKTNAEEPLYRTADTNNYEMETNYVKNGLILHYDAINNTGNGHSSTTNVWKDLSGNGHDGTVHGINSTTESGWHENYIALDGIDDYVGNENITVDGASGTVEIIAKYISGNSLNTGYMFRSNASGTRTYIWRATTHKGDPAVGIPFNTDNKVYELSSRVLKWFTNNGVSKASTYFNNNKSQEQTFTSTKNGTFISIGSFDSRAAEQLAKEDVYAVRIYNRALTDEEVAQNYNEDRIRFGL